MPNLDAEDGWLRGADRIAAYLTAPEAAVYALTGGADPGPPRRLGADRAALRTSTAGCATGEGGRERN